MSLSSEEAAASLTQVEEASRKSSQLYFYHRSSPHLILWGVIWIIGYGNTGLFPQYANLVWLILIGIGCIGGIILGRGCPTEGGVIAGPLAWRMGALWAIILFFVFATYAILEPHMSRQLCAYPALITGCAYMALGLWRGLRYLISGMVVATLTLVGFFAVGDAYVAFWFAVVGGSAMILTGLWFRTV